MPDELDVSIVIPVLNEADNLSAVLGDCANQRQPAAEVIVVDAGSTDGTRELLREREAGWAALRVLDRPGARPGAGRNAGIEAARSSIVVTLDGGTRVGPDWLGTLAGPVLEDPLRRCSVGVALPDPQSPFEAAAGSFSLQGFRAPYENARLLPGFTPPGRNGWCFARRSWEAVGGYDGSLRWGEDKRFARGLLGLGLELVVVEDAIVRWRPRSGMRELYRQYRGYGRGLTAAGRERAPVLAPLGLYATAAVLGTAAARGKRGAAGVLVAGAVGYLAGGGLIAAVRQQLPPRALAWVPPIRVAADLAKIHGFLDVSIGGADPSRD